MKLQSNSKNYRIPSLDGLRAISITIVILRHLYTQDYLDSSFRYIPILFDGQLGVNIFFIISGFIITSILIQEEKFKGFISLKKFYFRRAIRILPPFLFLLLFYSILQYNEIIYISLDSWITTLTFTKFLNGGTDWYTWHIWSLSVEEWFYLIWPFLFLRAKKNRQLILWLIIFSVPIIKILSVAKLLPTISDLSIFTRADAISIGCLLSFNRERIEFELKKNRKYFVGLLLAGMSLLAILYYYKTNKVIKIFEVAIGGSHGTISNCIIGLILIYSIIFQLGFWYKFLNNKIIILFGTLSYSLYLWQQFFILDTTNWFNKFPVNIILLIICSCLSYYLIEKTFSKFKSKME